MRHDVERKFLIWIRNWIELAESIIGIASLGFYHPWWSFRFITWQARHELIKRIQQSMKGEV